MSQTASKFTENWVDIKDIANGFIVNHNNEKITGVKIEPKNIFILDPITQENTIIALKNFYNSFDYEFWLIVADRPVDVAMYTANLQTLYMNTQDQRLRKLIGQDIEKANNFALNNIVDTEYYLLFKEKKPDVIQKRIRDLINGYASCGMTAMQTTTEDLRRLVDSFLNGGAKFESGTVIAR